MAPKARRWCARLMFVGLCLLSVEATSQLAYLAYKRSWYWTDRNRSARGMSQQHPYFGACLAPNVSDERNGVRISHNSFRCRGPEFERPNPGKRIRIATLGGSTTYCVGVSDGQTWQDYLRKELGDRYEIVNMASPAATSTETLIQAALLFSDVKPDIATFHLGWNDARVQHVKDLWPDWSDSHGKWMISFGLSGREMQERTATGYLLKRLAFHCFFPGMDSDKVMGNLRGTPDALTDRIDERALSHYERNLRNIVALCRKQGVEPVFIPQIMNYAILTSDQPYGWLPFVRDRDLKTVIAAYNQRMSKVAAEEGVLCTAGVLEPKYGDRDFIDNGHFSPSGHEMFAKALAPQLASVKRNATNAASLKSIDKVQTSAQLRSNN